MADGNGWSEWCRHVLAELERIDGNVTALDDRLDGVINNITGMQTKEKLCRRTVTDFIKEVRERDLREAQERRADRRAGRGVTIAIVACVVSTVVALASVVLSLIYRYGGGP